MTKNNIEVLYQDSQIIAVNKPPGISVTADRTGKMNLLEYLRLQLNSEEKLKIIHRLDKETSGIIILAKDTDAQRKFSQYFETGQVIKIYLAIITGFPSETSGIIDAPIGENRKNAQMMEVDFKNGKEAQTKWELVANFTGCSLIAARPLTGRTHQIRVHFHYAGMPLAVDPLYGSNKAIMLSSFKADYRLGKYEEEKPLIDRLTLCAYELKIENLELIAPLEKKFKAAIKMLTKYNPKGQDAFIEKDNFNRLMNSQHLLLKI